MHHRPQAGICAPAGRLQELKPTGVTGAGRLYSALLGASWVELDGVKLTLGDRDRATTSADVRLDETNAAWLLVDLPRPNFPSHSNIAMPRTWHHETIYSRSCSSKIPLVMNPARRVGAATPVIIGHEGSCTSPRCGSRPLIRWADQQQQDVDPRNALRSCALSSLALLVSRRPMARARGAAAPAKTGSSSVKLRLELRP